MDENLMKKVPVQVQKKSGFDKSYQNLLTTKVGTLTPLVCEEVIPNTTVNMKVALSAQLPPLATDTFMRCQLKTEAFFVPTRIIMDGYEDWLTGNDRFEDNSGEIQTPYVKLTKDDCMAGSLADYLGVMNNTGPSTSSASTIDVSALPFLAYHRIWDEWYRNSLVQKTIYTGKYLNNAYQGYTPATSKWCAPTTSTGMFFDARKKNDGIESWNGCRFADGKSITDLRQRNFGIDYFTSAQPKAQQGDAQKVTFNVETNNTGNFTIAALRAANSMQQFKERNGIAGNRMIDFVKAQFGANLNDSIAQRPVLLGSAAFDVYSKGIYQTANNPEGALNSNPFSSTAAKYGSAYAEGTDFLIKGFTAMEPGYIFVIVSLVPKVTYASGIRRDLLHYVGSKKQSDMANPILQNVGNQPIYSKEINFQNAFEPLSQNHVFGYTDRYAEFKTRNDELHGLLRDGQSLSAFALQRTFDGVAQEINSNFLEIPETYLDQVAAVDGDISEYGCWIDSYIDLKESMPLARYAVPSLQDPAYEHGETVVVDRGGKRIS